MCVVRVREYAAEVMEKEWKAGNTIIEERDAGAIVVGSGGKGAREVVVDHGVVRLQRPLRHRVVRRHTEHRDHLGLEPQSNN